jgi:hypothetical protein
MIVFFGGLPRACSTVIINILLQNPKFSGTAYRDHINNVKDVHFDKDRDWIFDYDNTIRLHPNAKFIAPIRDLRGIASSCDRIFPGHGYDSFKVEAGARADTLASIVKKHSDNIHVIKAEYFYRHPKKCIKKIYDFLKEEYFEHDFNNIISILKDDRGLRTANPNLHKIEPKVRPLCEDYVGLLNKNLAEHIVKQHKTYYNYFYPSEKTI